MTRLHKRFTKTASVLLATGVIALLALAVPALASAATYTVTGTGDTGTKTNCENASAECTLRGAIEAVNAGPGHDEIIFGTAFKGRATDKINLTSALPTITAAEVVVDGESAGPCVTGVGSGPCVQVNGNGHPIFEVESFKSTIEGLSLTNAQVGVRAGKEAESLEVAGNWIGEGLDGSEEAVKTGVEVDNGGLILENEIFGGEVGIRTTGENETGSRINGNLIEGTTHSGILLENDANGLIGNEIIDAGAAGVRIATNPSLGLTVAQSNSIGTPSAESGPTLPGENVIDGSAGPAIEIKVVEGVAGEPVTNNVFRNRGSGNTGKFVALVPFEPSETNGPNDGIAPPTVTKASGTKAEGTAELGATVRVFSKTTTATGEISGYLGIAEASETTGAWSLSYLAPAGATAIAFEQTAEAETGSSELRIVSPAKFALGVTTAGSGSGTVTGNRGGINCGNTCSAEFLEGSVLLRGAPASGSAAATWTGCTAIVGSNECEVALTAAKNVTATFNVIPTCANTPSLCPPANNTTPPASTVTPPATTTPPVTSKPAPVKKKPLVCKKGFAKKTVKGKASCVKVKKKKKKKH